MHLIEVPSPIVAPFPTPTIRADVAGWLADNAAGAWRVVHQGPPWADHAIEFEDQTDAALFRLAWL